MEIRLIEMIGSVPIPVSFPILHLFPSLAVSMSHTFRSNATLPSNIFKDTVDAVELQLSATPQSCPGVVPLLLQAEESP